MVAANSVLHLHSFDDFMDFFRCVVRHLLVNGRLIFDAFVPNIALLNREPGRRYPVGSIRHDPLGDVAVDESVSYDPITHINTQPGTGRPTERETSGMPPLDCG